VGRTRTFDIDQALDRAMLVFWRLGYDRASMAALTEAMDISRPSLYAAFGNKEELFKRALERYGTGPSAHEREALGQPTARRVAEALLHGAADMQTDARTPAGCLAVLGTTCCAEDSSPIGQALIAFRHASDGAVRERFERAHYEGDLPADADPEELTNYIRTVVYGMAVQASSGATRPDLDRVIERAMRAWPT
jgi:AcrR family transcriptional regulator